MRIGIIVAGIAAILIGLGFVFPALAAWRGNGTLLVSQTMLLLLGVVLTLAGVTGIAKAAWPRKAKDTGPP